MCRAHKLIGVGVGLAGIVDSSDGILRQSPFLVGVIMPVRDRLQQLLQSDGIN